MDIGWKCSFKLKLKGWHVLFSPVFSPKFLFKLTWGRLGRLIYLKVQCEIWSNQPTDENEIRMTRIDPNCLFRKNQLWRMETFWFLPFLVGKVYALSVGLPQRCAIGAIKRTLKLFTNLTLSYKRNTRKYYRGRSRSHCRAHSQGIVLNLVQVKLKTSMLT